MLYAVYLPNGNKVLELSLNVTIPTLFSELEFNIVFIALFTAETIFLPLLLSAILPETSSTNTTSSGAVSVDSVVTICFSVISPLMS